MKNPTNILGLVLTFLLTGLSTPAETNPPPAKPAASGAGPVYVIPIEGMIEPALVYVIRRGVLEAERADARALVIEMDTPGGRVDSTEEIIRILGSVTVPTYTLVKRNAISAGAIIAMGTKHIYMTPGSKIGDAMPIMAAPTGGVQPLPDAEREKITSYVDTIVRAAAEQNGHNVNVASCMVRRELEYVIDDVVICKEGQILTMTNTEAERRFGEDQEPLLSEGTVGDREDFLATVGLAGAEVRELQVTQAERLARFIAALAPLFLMGGMLGLYLEFKTPGFGVFGILGLIFLAIFFLGHHIAGLAGMEDIVLLAVGLILIVVELLFIPGFGLIGFTGLALVLGSLLSAMIERLPTDPVLPSWSQLEGPMRNLSLAFLLATFFAVLLARFLPKSRTMNWLVLGAATTREEGYTASEDTSSLVGQVGSALTDLHPSGAGLFGTDKLDVVSHGQFIEKGSPIRIVETHGNRIVVEQDNAPA